MIRHQTKRPEKTRVLMLGWEYPPRFAGGLGKACQGLAQAVARRGVQLYFVLPTFPDRVSEQRLEVVGAREVMMEAGWDPDHADFGASETGWVSASRLGRPERGDASAGLGAPGAGEGGSDGTLTAGSEIGPDGKPTGSITLIRSEAQLFPYGEHPQGRLPDRVYEMIRGFTSGEGHGYGPPAGGSGTMKQGTRPSLAGRRATVEPSAADAASGVPDAGAGLAGGAAPGKGAATGTASGAKGLDSPTAGPAPKPIIGGKEIYGRNLWSEVEKFSHTVRHLAEGHEVDAVHAHDWMTFPAAFEFQRMTGVPVFLHVHATEYDRSGENLNNDIFRIEREGFRRATHIFAVSRYTAGIIERLYGVNRKKISVVYNAPDESAREIVASADAPREPHVIFLGRLTFQKGPDHFLRAAELVCRANKDARFVMCGTGDMLDKLKGLAHRLGIAHRVDFAGFVDPAGVDSILSRSKVLVMPSVSEPFGLVALEAIHCGIPVILSKQSGVREVLQRALQVDFWDHEKLADQILAALRLPELSKQLVADGMEQLLELSWDKSAERVIDAYGKHLGSTYAQAIGGGHHGH